MMDVLFNHSGIEYKVSLEMFQSSLMMDVLFNEVAGIYPITPSSPVSILINDGCSL